MITTDEDLEFLDEEQTAVIRGPSPNLLDHAFGLDAGWAHHRSKMDQEFLDKMGWE